MSKLLNLGSVCRETKGTHRNKSADAANSHVMGNYALTNVLCKNEGGFTIYNQASETVDLDLSKYVRCS